MDQAICYSSRGGILGKELQHCTVASGAVRMWRTIGRLKHPTTLAPPRVKFGWYHTPGGAASVIFALSEKLFFLFLNRILMLKSPSSLQRIKNLMIVSNLHIIWVLAERC